MIIREASLCLRFYTSDGWKRKDVVELLFKINKSTINKNPNNKTPTPLYHYVCPRWFDNAGKDAKYRGFLYEDGWEHLDCDYYAVYHSDVGFDEEKLKQHTIIPFGSVAA